MPHFAPLTAADDAGTRLERSISTILKVVRDQLHLEVLFITEFVGEHRVFRHVCAGNSPSFRVGDSPPCEGTLCQQIVDGTLPKLVPNLPASRKALGLPLSPVHDVGLHIGVPVQLPDGRLYGTLCGFDSAPSDRLDERHVRRLEMAASAVARLLSQAEGHPPLYAVDEHDVATMPGVLC